MDFSRGRVISSYVCGVASPLGHSRGTFSIGLGVLFWKALLSSSRNEVIFWIKCLVDQLEVLRPFHQEVPSDCFPLLL